MTQTAPLPPVTIKQGPKIDLDTALAMREDGRQLKEIAQYFDCSIPCVSKAFKRYDNRPDVIQETMAQEFEKLGIRVA